MRMKHSIISLLISSLAWLAFSHAQELTPSPTPDAPLFAPIGFDMLISDSITAEAFYDWYSLSLNEGDRILIHMQGSDGLSPLIGVFDSTRNLLKRSDENSELAPVNGSVSLEFSAPASGEYVISATRSGLNIGLTTGSYTLEVKLVGQNPPLAQNISEVEFRCGDDIVDNVLELEFYSQQILRTDRTGVNVYELYRISVFSLDGFQPVIFASADIQDAPLDCTSDASSLGTGTLRLPDGTDYAFSSTDTRSMAQLILRNETLESPFGLIRLKIGKRPTETPSGGRFVVILEGLSLPQVGAQEFVAVRRAPFSRQSPLMLALIAAPTSRLNPVLQVFDAQGGLVAECDDSGRGTCADSPDLRGVGGLLALLGGTLLADRFDASLLLLPPEPPLSWQNLGMSARNGESFGDYALMIMGEMPPR